jgi:hypothetical protein
MKKKVIAVSIAALLLLAVMFLLRPEPWHPKVQLTFNAFRASSNLSNMQAEFLVTGVPPGESITLMIGSYAQATVLAAPEANQAAAADEQFVYAIDNSVIAKYDRATGKRLAVSTGEAKHLNSGFLWKGKLYCAHSNYPRKPEQSEIMVLDPISAASRGR